MNSKSSNTKMRRSRGRSQGRSVIFDTPEPSGNVSIVEDSVFDDSQVCLISFLISSISFYDFRFPIQLREAGGSMSVNLSGFESSPEAGICRQFYPEKKPSCVRVRKVPSVLQRLKTKSRLWWVSSVEKIPLQLKFLKATYLKNLLKIPLLLNLKPF